MPGKEPFLSLTARVRLVVILADVMQPLPLLQLDCKVMCVQIDQQSLIFVFLAA